MVMNLSEEVGCEVALVDGTHFPARPHFPVLAFSPVVHSKLEGASHSMPVAGSKSGSDNQKCKCRLKSVALNG
jgi:hypothetical protein